MITEIVVFISPKCACPYKRRLSENSREIIMVFTTLLLISSNTEYAKPLAGNTAASKHFKLKRQMSCCKLLSG